MLCFEFVFILLGKAKTLWSSFQENDPYMYYIYIFFSGVANASLELVLRVENLVSWLVFYAQSTIMVISGQLKT